MPHKHLIHNSITDTTSLLVLVCLCIVYEWIDFARLSPLKHVSELHRFYIFNRFFNIYIVNVFKSSHVSSTFYLRPAFQQRDFTHISTVRFAFLYLHFLIYTISCYHSNEKFCCSTHCQLHNTLVLLFFQTI